jgi:hypothetical protein
MHPALYPSPLLHQPLPAFSHFDSLLPHLEAGHQMLGLDMGFQSTNYIFPLNTHNFSLHGPGTPALSLKGMGRVN